MYINMRRSGQWQVGGRGGERPPPKERKEGDGAGASMFSQPPDLSPIAPRGEIFC